MNCHSFRLWKGGEHFRCCLSQNRVPPVGGHVIHGDQNEGAVLQTRMRQDQGVGCLTYLLAHRESAPYLKSRKIRPNLLIAGDQIDVQCAGCPAIVAGPTGFIFNFVTNTQHIFGSFTRL